MCMVQCHRRRRFHPAGRELGVRTESLAESRFRSDMDVLASCLRSRAAGRAIDCDRDDREAHGTGRMGAAGLRCPASRYGELSATLREEMIRRGVTAQSRRSPPPRSARLRALAAVVADELQHCSAPAARVAWSRLRVSMHELHTPRSTCTAAAPISSPHHEREVALESCGEPFSLPGPLGDGPLRVRRCRSRSATSCS
jgi:hypothetical protein